MQNESLAGVVNGRVGSGQECGHAAYVEYFALPSANLRQKKLGQMGHRNDVDLNHLRFVVPVGLEKRPAAAKARIVYQHVENDAGLLQFLIEFDWARPGCARSFGEIRTSTLCVTATRPQLVEGARLRATSTSR